MALIPYFQKCLFYIAISSKRLFSDFFFSISDTKNLKLDLIFKILDFYPIKISIFLLLKNGLQFLGII
jgi:hypothetical protein